MGSLTLELEADVGAVIDDGRVARDPVNVPMVRNFCDALGDDNPVYVDDDAARRAGFPGLVAPPGMLRTWTMAPPCEQMAPDDESGSSVYARLAVAGFTSKAATNCDVRFLRYLVPGDLLHCRTSLTGVSDQKATRLGVGHFVDTTMEFLDAEDRIVAEMGWRSLRFRPGSARPSGPVGRRPAPAVAPVEDVPGSWRIPITRTLVIAGAMASRDYQDVHHDPELARQRGMPDIFTNMMTTSGLLSRYVTDWSGPSGRIVGISQVLGTPNHPGDTLELRVTAASESTDRRTRTLTVSGTNSLGRHVLATVEMEAS